MVTDVLHILYSQRSPHRFPVNASAPALHLVPLSSASSYPKYPWQASQHTSGFLHLLFGETAESKTQHNKTSRLLLCPLLPFPSCLCAPTMSERGELSLPKHLKPSSIMLMDRGVLMEPQAHPTTKGAEGALCLCLVKG